MQAKVMNMLVTVLCALVMLPLRLLRVFVGTYLSRNEDVRRAGLVADVNALALAVAVILLLTSRATFNQAEETIKHQAWANLLQDSPGAACASLNQQPFVGHISQSIHFTCTNDPYQRTPSTARWTYAMDAKNMKQVVGVLRALDECKVFSMGMQYIYTDRSVCYKFANTSGSVSSVIEASQTGSLELVQNITGWDRLDVITPEDTYSPASAGEAGESCLEDYSTHARAVNGTCYSPAAPFGNPGFPSDLGFPRGMQIVRWLDRFGKGIFLGVKCGSSLHNPSPGLQRCINSSAQLSAVAGPWTPEFWADPRPRDPRNYSLHGHEHGAFCPANSTLGVVLYRPSLYQCSNGAQGSQVRLLNDEMAALTGVRYFAYFRCLSYDELFGVYVGTVGVLMSVALATGALYITDVARPMLLAGHEAWLWDVVLQSAGAIGPEVGERRCERAKTLFEVILRCVASCALGSSLGMILIYVPWQVFLSNHAHTCNP